VKYTYELLTVKKPHCANYPCNTATPMSLFHSSNIDTTFPILTLYSQHSQQVHVDCKEKKQTEKKQQIGLLCHTERNKLQQHATAMLHI